MAAIEPQNGDPCILTDGHAIPVTAPVKYAPNVGETGLVFGGQYYPLAPQYESLASGDVPLPVIQNANPFIFPRPQGLSHRGYQPDLEVHPPRIWTGYGDNTEATLCCLDTPVDADTTEQDKAHPNYLENPGVSILSYTHLFYPTADADADPLFYDMPGFIWRATATWTKTGASTGTLSLSAGEGSVDTIKYILASTGEPDTTYTGAIAISSTALVRFRLYIGTWTSPIYTQHVVFSAGVAPESFAKTHPLIATTTDDEGTNLDGATNHSGVHYRWVHDAAATPKPTTLTSAAVGTQYLAPFVPISGTTGTSISGTLKVVAYRYGLQVSDLVSKAINIKIGKIGMEWDGTDALTLTCGTSGATIKYRLNQTGAYLTYSAPLTIEETTVVQFYAEKASMTSSDLQTFTVTFTDDEPPAAYDDFWWSDYRVDASGTPWDTTSSRTQKHVLDFQRRPDYYITPDGTGDGLTPSTPGNMETIIGTGGDGGSPGSATAGDVVWASEGVYDPSVVADGVYWAVASGVILKGGYSTDFTERDVLNRKSIFYAPIYEVEDFDNTWYYVVEYTVLNSGTVDGFWSDSELLRFEDQLDPIEAYSEAEHFSGGGVFYNCHVDINRRFLDSATSRSVSYYLEVFSGESPTLYGCTVSIDVVLPDRDWSDPGEPFSSPDGSSYMELITAAGTWCNYSINWVAGIGAGSEAKLTLSIPITGHHNTITATVKSGESGFDCDSIATAFINSPGSYSTLAASIEASDAGGDGRSIALCEDTFTTGGPLVFGLTENISAVAGNGGSYYLEDFDIWFAGYPHASVTRNYGVPCFSNQTYYAAVGTVGGPDVVPDTYLYECFISAQRAQYPISFTAETVTADHAYIEPTKNGVENPDSGLYFQLDQAVQKTAVAITEDDTFPIIADGNYSRVEGSTIDFYSGGTNGDNVPVDGYDSGGGGATLGRYWES